ARTDSYIMVRLPGPVEPLFLDWLNREFPARAAKVIHRLREIRSGLLSDSRFGTRMRGEGKMAESIDKLFRLACRKYHLNESVVAFSTDKFIRLGGSQLTMFLRGPHSFTAVSHVPRSRD